MNFLKHPQPGQVYTLRQLEDYIAARNWCYSTEESRAEAKQKAEHKKWKADELKRRPAGRGFGLASVAKHLKETGTIGRTEKMF